MDKQKANAIGAAVEAALAPVAQRFGLTVKVLGGVFDTGGQFKPRVVFESGELEVNTFRRDASMMGFSPEDYGRGFTMRGVDYVLFGFKPGSRLSVLARRADNAKPYRLMARDVRAALPVEVSSAAR